MTDTNPDLTPLIALIVFGTTGLEDGDPGSMLDGGIIGAAELDADYMVEEDDLGERPGYPFGTFLLIGPGSEVEYGPPHNDYQEVVEDPEDETQVFLVRKNARQHRLRLYFYGQQAGTEDDQTVEGDIRVMANRVQRYLEARVNRELDLLGIDARVISSGGIRNATTVLNETTEIRLGLDVELLVGETYSTTVPTFDKFTMTIAEGPAGDEEEKEIDL